MAENSPIPQAVFDCLQRQRISASQRCSPQEIIRYGAFVGSVIESYSSLPRAMDNARQLIRSAADDGKSVASGTVILADTMSSCKGRFTREWHAPVGGVWGCMIHANTLLPQSRQFVSLGVGVACCETVRESGGEGALLRWVNDLLVDGRKLAGFLIETYTERTHGEEFTLVGFGINVNNSAFPPELTDCAVSLAAILGKHINLTHFTTLFLAKLAWCFGILYHEETLELRGESFSGSAGRHMLLERWLQLSDTVGRKVVYGFDVMTAPQYRAEVLGIDEYGGLVLKLEDGFVKTEYSGEVRYVP
jgi:BirA family biotin operon repressor/biotin-[acetyl-CoA-carboxylase] ligase